MNATSMSKIRQYPPIHNMDSIFSFHLVLQRKRVISEVRCVNSIFTFYITKSEEGHWWWTAFWGVLAVVIFKTASNRHVPLKCSWQILLACFFDMFLRHSSLQNERRNCAKKHIVCRKELLRRESRWWWSRPHIVLSESAKSTRMAGQKMIGNPQFWQAPNSNSVKSSTIFACWLTLTFFTLFEMILVLIPHKLPARFFTLFIAPQVEQLNEVHLRPEVLSTLRCSWKRLSHRLSRERYLGLDLFGIWVWISNSDTYVWSMAF